MASEYSNRLKIELIGAGEQAGSWGVTTNNNFGVAASTGVGAIEHSIAGVLAVAITSNDATQTLTTGDGPQTQALNQARQAALNFTGSDSMLLQEIRFPATQKLYMLINSTNKCVITLRLGSSGNTISLLPLRSKMVATDGTDWFDLKTDTADYLEVSAATVTALAGDRLLVNTRSNAVEIDLPTPVEGDEITIIDATGHFDTNNLTVDPGSSHRIEDKTNGHKMIVDTNFAAFTLVYHDNATAAYDGWRFKDK